MHDFECRGEDFAHCWLINAEFLKELCTITPGYLRPLVHPAQERRSRERVGKPERDLWQA